MLSWLFKEKNTKLLESSHRKATEVELKNLELEKKLLQSNVELEQIKAALRETQVSLQLILTSYQGLAEEVSTLHDVLYAMMSPAVNKNSFRFSFREDEGDDDDNWN